MNSHTLRRYFLPIGLGLLSLLLVGRVLSVGAGILIPEDVDVLLLLGGLAAVLILAIHTLVRLSMNYLRQLSVERLRRETLAEHARFLRRLDHELKNPLTTLRTGLKTLTLTGLNEQQQRLTGAMEAEVLRMIRLVTALRNLADMESQPLNLRPVRLEDFVAGLVQNEEERLAQAGLSLTPLLEASQPVWILDEDLLSLAVHNLLDNARKYASPGGAVELRVVADSDLLIQVWDNGQGIAPEYLPHVWEELYRADPLGDTAGSGIGLALVKTIVERHGGGVAIDSQPGQGTTVSLRLPPGEVP